MKLINVKLSLRFGSFTANRPTYKLIDQLFVMMMYLYEFEVENFKDYHLYVQSEWWRLKQFLWIPNQWFWQAVWWSSPSVILLYMTLHHHISNLEQKFQIYIWSIFTTILNTVWPLMIKLFLPCDPASISITQVNQ